VSRAGLSNSTASCSGFDRACDGLAMLILLTVAILAALTFRDYGLGWDDYTHAQYGDLLLSYYGSGFKDQRAFSFVNLFRYGGGFDMAAGLAAKVLPFGLFETRRLIGALVGVVGLAVTWRLARRVAGPPAGTLALALLATCPLYYGHIFINAKDAPFAVTMTILLYGVVRVLEGYPRPSWSARLIFAAGLGLAIGTRIMAVLSALYALPALALIVAHDIRHQNVKRALAQCGRFILALVPGLIVAYAIMVLVWPWAMVDPLAPVHALTYFSHFFEQPWHEMFAGRLITVTDMPRSYLPTLFALKLPEALTVLGLGGAIGCLFAAARRSVAINRRAVFLCLALAALVPVMVTILLRPALYNSVRHFVFVLPPFAVLGGIAGAWLIDDLWRRAQSAALVVTAIIVAALAVPIADMARLHPYQYIHFNRTAGGIPGSHRQYMLDYWGLSFKEAAQGLRSWLADHHVNRPSDRPWRVAVCGPHPPARVALGDGFDLTYNPKGVDFAISLGTFYCVPLDAPVLVEIKRDGVVLARVYDTRGRAVPRIYPDKPCSDADRKAQLCA